MWRSETSAISLMLLLLVSCGGKIVSQRDELFTELMDVSTAREAICRCEEAFPGEPPAVSCEEVELWAQLPDEMQSAIRALVDKADDAKVSACLSQIREYNTCYLALSCEVLGERAMPAWQAGTAMAPCGCGVDHWRSWPSSGRGLPESLDACLGLAYGPALGPLSGVVEFDCSKE
jgi:hypothetical protein